MAQALVLAASTIVSTLGGTSTALGAIAKSLETSLETADTSVRATSASGMISAAEGYRLWAESWDATPSPIVAVEERVVGGWLQARYRRVVDAGCGTGRWTERLGAVGFDLSPEMLSVATGKRGLRGRVTVSDLRALPVRSGVADLVLCTLTLGHVPDARAAMRELARVAEPGGTVVLTDFHPRAAESGWRRTFRKDGRVYEIENYPYRIEELQVEGLVLEECREGTIGESERELFERAGRLELFAAACRMPVVLATRWRRL